MTWTMWSSSTAIMDSLVRDYICQRGFNNTLKAFDVDIKNDKDKGFRVEKVVQHILSFVYNYDLESLRSYWNYLDSRFFCQLDQAYSTSIKKLEHNLYRLYIVNSIQSNKRKECVDLYEKMSTELHSLPEWKEWFALPFIPHPETSKQFSNYFNKQWPETFLASLHNFLAVVFACMKPPDLLREFNQNRSTIKRLEKEIAKLKLFQENENEISEAPNYVKSLGVPVALLKEPIVALPQKKKNPFNFSTKKSQPSQSSPKQNSSIKMPQKTAPKQLKQVPVPSKGHPTQNELSITPQQIETPPTVIPSYSSEKLPSTTRSKKVSGYKSQREELFGTRTETKSPPINQIASKIESNSTIISTSPADVTFTSNHRNNFQTPSENVSQKQNNVRNDDFKPSSIPSFSPNPWHQNAAENQKSFLLLSKDDYSEHHSSIVQSKFSTSGGRVASCDIDGVVKIWKYEPKVKTIATVMSRSSFLSIEWCKSNDAMLILGTSNGVLRLYNTVTKQTEQDLNVSDSFKHINQIACHPSDHVFATSCVAPPIQDWGSSGLNNQPKGRLLLWDINDKQISLRQRVQEVNDNGLSCLRFNGDGSFLVCGDQIGNVLIIEGQNYSTVTQFRAHEGAIYSVSFSKEGRIFYTLGADGKLSMWDISKLGNPLNLPIHSSAAGPFEVSGYSTYKQAYQPRGGQLMALDPLGDHILTCDGMTGLVYKVDTKLGNLSKVLTLTGHRSPVVSLDWTASPNCGHCLAGSMDGKICVSTLLNQ